MTWENKISQYYEIEDELVEFTNFEGIRTILSTYRQSVENGRNPNHRAVKRRIRSLVSNAGRGWLEATHDAGQIMKEMYEYKQYKEINKERNKNENKIKNKTTGLC